ncbi:hypothetical protein GQ55_3G399200 [Panicum hallii var. hallii]|uniref:Uncharacterized protein n=1 Tax=Panicum hallii var. hallii TaxID=1504633 RepID=A0A2T7EGS7_9POAL|nr:hypothetical protein GQ55_3G399200 [Panicum hallii var. hallii]
MTGAVQVVLEEMLGRTLEAGCKLEEKIFMQALMYVLFWSSWE